MTKQLTYLVKVTEAVEEWVTSHGAYFDTNVNRWVVDGDVPPELESYVEKTRRVRNHVAERTPQCELCGCQMLLRNSAYGEFWGCSAFPRCEGKRSVAAKDFDQFSECVGEKQAKLASKSAVDINDDRNVVERAQSIYDRATELFGSRKAAQGWLTTNKVGLGHQTPVDVMRTMKGCDSVEKLLNERFERN